MLKILKKHLMPAVYAVLSILLAGMSSTTYADTLARHVIAASGDKIVVGSNSLSYTIGQPFISTDYSSRLTAGFLGRRSEPLLPVKLVAIVSNSPVCLDEPFDVTFQVVTEDIQPVSNMGVYLEFDPKKMTVNSIESSGELDFTLTDRFNNDSGYIHFVASSLMNPPLTGTFDLIKVNFTAWEETEETFLHLNPEKSSVGFGGKHIPQEADDTKIAIEQCGPKGCQVTLQRTHPAPHASWDKTALIISGDVTDAIETDNSGHCELTKSLADGNYVICAKNPRTLQNKIEPTIPLADGSEVIKFGTLLEGDFNNNNILDANSDFGYLITTFQAGVYKAKADLNVDGALTPDDVFLFQNNFNRRPDGEVELHGKTCTSTTRKAELSHRLSQDGKPINGMANLRTAPIPQGLTKGSTFNLPIQVTKPVQVAGTYLNFNPEFLKVNSMTPGNHLDFVLQNYFNNTTGIINFTAGLLEGEIVEGSFTLVTINFTVLAEGAEKMLAFNMTPPRAAHAMFGGEPVIAPGEKGSEVILEENIVPASCQVYAVNDKGLNNSQLFTVSLDGELTVSKLGPLYKGYDIEALAIHPTTNRIYAASSDNVTNGNKGYLYQVDGETGELFPIGSTGFREIEDLAFHPDGTLYAWAKGDGLISIDLGTGAGILRIPNNNVLVEGLTLSKKEGHTIFYGSVDKTLWVYDVDAGTLEIACTNLLGETEALEITSNDILLVGTHNAPFGLHTFHVPTCQIMITDETLSNQFKFKDVEGIALPINACGQ